MFLKNLIFRPTLKGGAFSTMDGIEREEAGHPRGVVEEHLYSNSTLFFDPNSLFFELKDRT